MRRKLIASVVVLLALSAGVAYAATQLSSEVVTQVCVNDTNGLMRASSECRLGEHLATLGGGGGSVQVTQNGTFTVASGQTVGKALPLTGITVSGKCEGPDPSDPYGQVFAKVLLEAASEETMDVFLTSENVSFGGNTVGVQSLLFDMPIAVGTSTYRGSGGHTMTAASKGATATISIGGVALYSATTPTCKFLWQAVEAPN